MRANTFPISTLHGSEAQNCLHSKSMLLRAVRVGGAQPVRCDSCVNAAYGGFRCAHSHSSVRQALGGMQTAS
jgi:hypothetical protein